ncbi:hypothetical protein K9M47_02180 [Candidatus Gracilibacteria bacterium]|nr:hypothetical protein [Candidatus Gracilibacteria bacterium]
MKYKTAIKSIKFTFYVLLVIFIFSVYIFFKHVQEKYISINSFDDCSNAGYEILPTYPEQCKIPGKIFVNKSQSASFDNFDKNSTSSQKLNSPRNTSYDIEGNSVILNDGAAVINQTENGIISNNIVQYVGNELRVDVNSDNLNDSAFILTSKGTGNETYYYLVVSLNKNNAFTGTNGAYLGDRIIPQSTEFINGEIVVKYLDRQPLVSKLAVPNLKVVRYFKISDDTLTEVVK